ncbi:hypothetical protein [Spirochaeta dissipatitropha]
MKKIITVFIALTVVLSMTACSQATAESEYQAVIEDMAGSYSALAADLTDLDNADEVISVLDSYSGDFPAFNSRFMALDEKYPDTDLELLFENEGFAAAVSSFETANTEIGHAIMGLEQRFGENEAVQMAVFNYIMSMSMTEEDLAAEEAGAADAE